LFGEIKLYIKYYPYKPVTVYAQVNSLHYCRQPSTVLWLRHCHCQTVYWTSATSFRFDSCTLPLVEKKISFESHP